MNKYGVRPVVIAGSLLAAISFAASIFSPNAYVFMLSYGVFGGRCLFLFCLDEKKVMSASLGGLDLVRYSNFTR